MTGRNSKKQAGYRFALGSQVNGGWLSWHGLGYVGLAYCNGILYILTQDHLKILENDIDQQIIVLYALGPQALPREAMHFLQTS